jgi:hypothetical protein
MNHEDDKMFTITISPRRSQNSKTLSHEACSCEHSSQNQRIEAADKQIPVEKKFASLRSGGVYDSIVANSIGT